MSRRPKIFIDVGGYHGESARAALDPRFGFDQVYCFEPVRSCFDYIVAHLRDPRLHIINAGLLDRNQVLPVYQAGTVGGSVYSDAPDLGGPVKPEMCEFRAAGRFFREAIPACSTVWMKLNCEGSECKILLDLIACGEDNKLTEVLLDLDARKMQSASEELRLLEVTLERSTFSFHFPEEVQYSMVTNFGAIRNWLVVTGAIEPGLAPLIQSLCYQGLAALDGEINGYYKVRLLRMLGMAPPALVPTKAGSLVGRKDHRTSLERLTVS